MSNFLLSVLVGGLVLLGAAGLANGDPVEDTAIVLDAEAGLSKRTAALERLWAAGGVGGMGEEGGAGAGVRATLKNLIWKSSAPSPLRQNALAKLLVDRTPAVEADTRNLLRLRLPTEAQWPVIDDICAAVRKRVEGDGGSEWKELTGSLVRSYARKVPVPPDADRPERGALLALYPGKTIEEIAFQVYLKPEGEVVGLLEGQMAELLHKQRLAAWELLGRLDADGAQRAAMLETAATDDPALVPIRKAATELKVVPVTGSELAWVTGLLDTKDAGADAYWSEASAAVQRLGPDQLKGVGGVLQLRNVEAVRWAAKNQPEWLVRNRSQLLAEFGERLQGRRKWRKTADMGDSGRLSKETLEDWQNQMSWGDLLTVLVVDEALKDAGVLKSLFKQAGADRADTSSEYGGGLWSVDTVPGAPAAPKWGVKQAVDGAGAGGFVAHGYTPRPGQRVNDRTFVAPEEMFTAEGAGGRALAHYHFHVQSISNSDYAGPGVGDLEYAATHGRTCVVFTSVREGVLNADYYQRNGAMIDLGEFREGSKEDR